MNFYHDIHGGRVEEVSISNGQRHGTTKFIDMRGSKPTGKMNFLTAAPAVDGNTAVLFNNIGVYRPGRPFILVA